MSDEATKSNRLAGKRVLVTRPGEQAATTAELLRARGAEAIELPTIAVGPPPDPARVALAVRELGGYDVVAFTSENGVAWLFRELDAQGMDARAFGGIRVAAVGKGTAAALAARGVRVAIVPGEFRGEGLANAILESTPARAVPPRVLVPRALVGREALPSLLAAGGCDVTVVAVYETRPASKERRDELVSLLEAHALDAALLTSGSTVDSLADLLAPRHVELLEGVVLASIGPVTTAAAEQRGLAVALTAPESTMVSLLDALEAHWTK